MSLAFLFALILALISPDAPETTPSIGEAGLPIVIACILLPLFGIFEGFWVGLTSGVFLAILSRIFFFPLKNAQRFLSIARTTNALFSVTVFIFSSSLIIVDKSSGHMLWITFFAAVVVGFGVWLITLPIVKWYERESTKRVAENVSPN